ncbi:MAG: hypothetical protein E7369_02675 [Clostridiales bacterium]|nr:hypothetical protein [Clostridiales bacterium]
MKFKSNKILKGSMVLAVGAFLSKLLGAVYRIPLTNLLGGEGLGLYQMIFPVYCVLLDFSGTGANSALSSLISKNKDPNYAKNLLSGSLRLLAIFGGIFSVLMAGLSTGISTLQGNKNAFLGYLTLSPAVILVALISCYRGYFQGKMNMTPTAVSQVIEQLVKLVLGLLLVKFLMPNVRVSVAGATLAVTLSEAVALLYLFILYNTQKKTLPLQSSFDKEFFKTQLKPLLKYTFTVTLTGVLLPLSQVVDSFLIINIISGYRGDATTLYGLYSGAATTVINLPVSLCYGIATVAIPAVAGASTPSAQKKRVIKTILLTLILALPLGVACYFFAPLIVRVLYNALPIDQKILTVDLIKFTSVNVVLLSLLQTTNGILFGKGNLKTPVISMLTGVLVKTILNAVLLKDPKLNVFATVISVIACYFTVCLINLMVVFKLKVKNASKKPYGRQPDPI